LSTIEMRNIALSGTWRSVVQGGNITITAVDVDRACIWIASERSNADADIEMDVYKRGLPDDSYEMDKVRARLEKPGERIGPSDSLPLQVAPTELIATLVSSANRTVPDTVSQVASLRSVPGEESLVVITRGGDIASMKLEDPDSQAR
jgi:elongator complex protein 1